LHCEHFRFNIRKFNPQNQNHFWNFFNQSYYQISSKQWSVILIFIVSFIKNEFWKNLKKKKNFFSWIFFSFTLYITSNMTFGGCLTTKNARSRHEINFGGSIGTMWSEKSCCILVQSGANNSTHSSLISGLVFLLVNFHKFENYLKTVMLGLSYLPPKAIYHPKIASKPSPMMYFSRKK